MLNPKTRSQYISLLIKLVDLNSDKQWLDEFYGLKSGSNLMGGMGSVNDWGPSYALDIEHYWFSTLYYLTHTLFIKEEEPCQINMTFIMKFRHELTVNLCDRCDRKYVHPRVFENCVASHYFGHNFYKFNKQDRLADLVNPNFSYNNIESVMLRNSLFDECIKNDIKLDDLVKRKYNYKTCRKMDGTNHIYYDVTEINNRLVLSNKHFNSKLLDI